MMLPQVPLLVARWPRGRGRAEEELRPPGRGVARRVQGTSCRLCWSSKSDLRTSRSCITSVRGACLQLLSGTSRPAWRCGRSSTAPPSSGFWTRSTPSWRCRPEQSPQGRSATPGPTTVSIMPGICHNRFNCC